MWPQRREARQHDEQPERPHRRLPRADAAARAPQVREQHPQQRQQQRRAQHDERRPAAERVEREDEELEEPVVVGPARGRGQHREEGGRGHRVVLGDPASARQVVPEVAVGGKEGPRRGADRDGREGEDDPDPRHAAGAAVGAQKTGARACRPPPQRLVADHRGRIARGFQLLSTLQRRRRCATGVRDDVAWPG